MEDNSKIYPDHLIPKKTNGIIKDINVEDILIRRVGFDCELLLKEPQRINRECILTNFFNPSSYKQSFTYSVNKIPDSRVDDLEFLFKKDNFFCDDWNPGTEVEIPNSDDFSIVKCKYFSFKIKHIQIKINCIVPELNAEFYDIRVVHKPLNGNYWHFELNGTILNQNNEPISISRNNEKCKLVAQFIIDHIAHCANRNLDQWRQHS